MSAATAVADGVCRAGCGEPLDATRIDADGTGLHAGCVAEPEPLLPVLHGILARHQEAMPRSRQATMGASGLGEPCDRALAYSLARVPPARPEPLKWAPLLGTWTHAGIAEALAEENRRLGRERYLVEQKVIISDEPRVTGTTDVFDQDTAEVVDWKLVSAASIKRKRKHGPGETYRVQAHAYGLGWRNAGMQPRSVRVVFLPKSSLTLDDGWEWSEPFRPDVAEAALKRLRWVQHLVHACGLRERPDGLALIRATPDAELGCQWCPWRRDEWLPTTPADGTGCPGMEES